MTVLSVSAVAIPNSIGGVFFPGAAGVTFEDFATDSATWQPGATLKGEWTPIPGPDAASSSVRLKQGAEAFGVGVDRIVAMYEGDELSSFVIYYKVDPESNDRDRLLKILHANIGAYAGKSEGGPERTTFIHDGFVIAVATTDSGAEVTISPAEARQTAARSPAG